MAPPARVDFSMELVAWEERNDVKRTSVVNVAERDNELIIIRVDASRDRNATDLLISSFFAKAAFLDWRQLDNDEGW